MCRKRNYRDFIPPIAHIPEVLGCLKPPHNWHLAIHENDRKRFLISFFEQFQGFSLEAEVANRFADVLCAKYDALKDED